MKPVTTAVVAAFLLAACQNADPTSYHHAAAHPYEVTESSVDMPLEGLATDVAAERAAMFATDRPNNGSSFVVAASHDVAEAVLVVLLHAGVDRRDIRLVPDAIPAKIVRTDRFGSVSACAPVPRSLAPWQYVRDIDDGYGRDNSSGSLFGCAVRGNIVQMLDDPRTLAVPRPASGREGSRAAAVHDRWIRGEHTGSKALLSNDGTTTSDLSGGGSE